MGHHGRKKRGNRFPPFPLKKCLFMRFGLAKVTLQQALESLAVTGLVAGHLVDGVVDGVEIELLGELGELEFCRCKIAAISTGNRVKREHISKNFGTSF